MIVGSLEQRAQLERVDIPLQRVSLPIELLVHPRIGFQRDHLLELEGVARAVRQPVERLEHRLERLYLPNDVPRLLLVGPEAGLRHRGFVRREPAAAAFYVKDTSAARSAVHPPRRAAARVPIPP